MGGSISPNPCLLGLTVWFPFLSSQVLFPCLTVSHFPLHPIPHPNLREGPRH